MDIREFVKESLVQIATGVKEANTALKESTKQSHTYFTIEASVRAEGRRGVEFDIAVAVKEESGTKGGAKLLIPWISIGGDRNSKNTSECISRIKFNVAMEYNLS